MCIPFAWNHEAVIPITWDSQDWVGKVEENDYWYYADYMLLLTFGGIPWQVKHLYHNQFSNILLVLLMAPTFIKNLYYARKR